MKLEEVADGVSSDLLDYEPEAAVTAPGEATEADVKYLLAAAQGALARALDHATQAAVQSSVQTTGNPSEPPGNGVSEEAKSFLLEFGITFTDKDFVLDVIRNEDIDAQDDDVAAYLRDHLMDEYGSVARHRLEFFLDEKPKVMIKALYDYVDGHNLGVLDQLDEDDMETDVQKMFLKKFVDEEWNIFDIIDYKD